MVYTALDALLKCRRLMGARDDDDYFARLVQSDACIDELERCTCIQDGSYPNGQGHPRHLSKIIPEES
jgi:hypothetical protein